ncbi:uncharacterized protein KY384_006861 [Bacidia gigantensis]|uniref:uncharacterized protein n=1 Tax=Bacidia gigantensis TaxID=2732470 RepID=UPI001D04809A|nr:uncharacterized protein KY384_006861 [Bacidia gigantensis]KAG8527945.1 hypothetical protein KY384_006861 [Bacidia gigantensis]
MASNILNSAESVEVVKSLQSSDDPNAKIPMSFEMSISNGWADIKLVGGSLSNTVTGSFAAPGIPGMGIQFSKDQYVSQIQHEYKTLELITRPMQGKIISVFRRPKQTTWDRGNWDTQHGFYHV